MKGVLQQPASRGDLQIYPNQLAAIPAQKKLPLVLIAERDAEDRHNLKALLDLYGINVLEAENGEEAFDLTVRERPDLILLNAVLPKLDGYEAARLIRNIKSLDSVPVILLSVETERPFRSRAFAVGAHSFHIAPLDLERLDWIMEKFLFRTS